MVFVKRSILYKFVLVFIFALNINAQIHGLRINGVIGQGQGDRLTEVDLLGDTNTDLLTGTGEITDADGNSVGTASQVNDGDITNLQDFTVINGDVLPVSYEILSTTALTSSNGFLLRVFSPAANSQRANNDAFSLLDVNGDEIVGSRSLAAIGAVDGTASVWYVSYSDDGLIITDTVLNPISIIQGSSKTITAKDTSSIKVGSIFNTAGATPTYTFVGGTATKSVIATDGTTLGTLSISAGNIINYQAASGVIGRVSNFEIQVNDGTDDSAIAFFNIENVANIAPTVAAQSFFVDENVDGAVGRVQASDVDGDVLTYSVATGSPFSIDSTGVLTLSTAQDFETTPRLTVDVTVTDSAGLFSTATITVNIRNVNEAASLSSITGDIEEGGTIRATLTALDGLDGVVVSFELLDASNNILATKPITGSGTTADVSFDLAADQSLVGKRLRIRASYRDESGTVYAVTPAAGQLAAPISAETSAVSNVEDAGVLSLTGDIEEGGTISTTLTDLDGLDGVTVSFELLDASNNILDTDTISGSGTTATVSFDLVGSFVGKALRIRASYTDESGTVYAVTPTVGQLAAPISAATLAVSNVEDAGVLSDITGAVEEGGTISTTLTDVDGLAGVDVIFELLDASNNILDTDTIDGSGTTATVSFDLADDQSLVGKVLRIRASYTDESGTIYASSTTNGRLLSPISAATLAVSNVEDAGVLSDITGAVEEGGTISTTLTDVDGLAGVTVSFELLDANNNILATKPITGSGTRATVSFDLEDDQSLVGKVLRIRASYRDESGTVYASSATNGRLLSPISAATLAVSNVEDAGVLSDITGDIEEGGTISTTLTDLDGLASVTVSFELLDESNNILETKPIIGGGTTATVSFDLAADQRLVGKVLRIRASYRDESGTIYAVTPTQGQLPAHISAETVEVSNVDDVGVLSDITGDIEEGGTISTTLTDLDGLDGVFVRFELLNEDGDVVDFDIITGGGTTATVSFALADDQSLVDQALRIRASYTDAENTIYAISTANGQLQSPISAATVDVSNVDDVGVLSSISGASIEEGGVINAILTDFDGLDGGVVTFELLDEGNNILFTKTNIGNGVGADVSFDLAADQSLVGQALRIRASYTDAENTVYAVTPTAGQLAAPMIVFAEVSNVDDAGVLSAIIGTDGSAIIPASVNSAGVVSLISGVVEEGGTISTTLTDLDGLDGVAVTFQLLDESGAVVETISDSGAVVETTATSASGVVTTELIPVTFTAKIVSGIGTTADVSFTIRDDQSLVGQTLTIRAFYTDQFNTRYGNSRVGGELPAPIAGTVAVSNVDNVGVLSEISGDTEEGGTISTTLTDIDGLDGVDVTFELLDESGAVVTTEGSVIAKTITGIGTTATVSFTLSDDQSLVGQVLKIRAFYTDEFNAIYVISPGAGQLAAPIVDSVAVSNVEDAGVLSEISGDIEEGGTISTTLTDLDGLDGVFVRFQLLDASNNILDSDIISGSGTTADVSFDLAADQSLVGQILTIRAFYTDAENTFYATSPGVGQLPARTVDSVAVSNVDDVGVLLAITGVFEEGGTISTTLTDVDGLAGVDVTFELLDESGNVVDFTTIRGSDTTAAVTFSLAADQSLVGEALRIRALYTDEFGTEYGIGRLVPPISAETVEISNVEDAGVLSEISGDIEEGGTISTTLTDLDGLDGVDVTFELLDESGAVVTTEGSVTAKTITGIGTTATVSFILAGDQSLVGQELTIRAFYTDEFNAIYAISPGAGQLPARTVDSIAVKNVEDVGFLLAISAVSNVEDAVNLLAINENLVEDGRTPGDIEEGGTISTILVDVDGVSGVAIIFELLDENGEILKTKTVSGTGITAAVSFDLADDQSLVGQELTIRASYMDVFGTVYTISPETGQFASRTVDSGIVLNVEDAGFLSDITGAVEEGGTISTTLTDEDGIDAVIVTFELLDENGGIVETKTIEGSNTIAVVSFTLADDQSLVGQELTIRASYTDVFGQVYVAGQLNEPGAARTVDSVAVSNVEDAGVLLAITGAVEEGGTISTILIDEDGLDGVDVKFELLDESGAILDTKTIEAGGVAITVSFDLKDDQSLVGQVLTIRASYTDVFDQVYAILPEDGTGQLAARTVDSVAVSNVDDAGVLSEITGAVEEGGTISIILTDEDGLDGLDVTFELLDESGAVVTTETISGSVTAKTITGSGTTATVSFNLADDQSLVGQELTIRASYTDAENTIYAVLPGVGQLAAPVSAETVEVSNVEDVGVLSDISGDIEEGGTISTTLTDLDGLDGLDVTFELLDESGAVVTTETISGSVTAKTITGSGTTATVSFDLADDQSLVGQALTIRAFYTDEFDAIYAISPGTGELPAPISAATVAVSNVEDASFLSSITGDIEAGGIISTTLTDVDGLTGVDVKFELLDESGSVLKTRIIAGRGIIAVLNLILPDDQSLIGQALKIRASYTDAFGTVYAIAPKAGELPAPIIAISVASFLSEITGVVEEGGTISTTLTDLDGIAGVATFELLDESGKVLITKTIAGSGTTATVSLILPDEQSLVGQTLTIRASYTDELGTVYAISPGAGQLPARTVDSTAVSNVEDVGVLSEISEPEEGGIISTTLTDVDGLDGVDVIFELLDEEGAVVTTEGSVIAKTITGIGTTATVSFTLSDDQSLVGQTLTIRASYTDEDGQLYALVFDASAGELAAPISASSAVVSNVNDAPTVVSQRFTVENIANVVVGIVVADDVDDDAGDVLEYSVASNEINFSINSITGALTLLVAQDLSTVTSLMVDVTVTDRAGLTDTATITVDIVKVNNAPIVAAQSFDINENVAGVSVGMVEASDVDAGDSFVYSVASDEMNFDIDPSSGELTLLVRQNFETTPSLTVDVTVTDRAGLTDTATITVNILNVNDAPKITLPADSIFIGVSANIAGKVLVSTFNIIDDDLGTNTISITGRDASKFTLDRETNELFLKGRDDVTTTIGDELRITLNVDDSTIGGSASMVDFILTIIDNPATSLLQAPRFQSPSFSPAEDALVVLEKLINSKSFSFQVNQDAIEKLIAVTSQPQEVQDDIIEELTPEIHATIAPAVENIVKDIVANAASRSLAQTDTGFFAPNGPVAETPGKGGNFWYDLSYSTGGRDSKLSTPGYNSNGYSIRGGYERAYSEVFLGGTFSYSNNNITNSNNEGTTDISTLAIGLYGNYKKDKEFYTSTLLIAFSDIETRRNRPGLDNANSTSDAFTFDLNFTYGQVKSYTGVDISFLTGLRYSNTSIDDIKENSGNFSVDSNSASYDGLYLKFGAIANFYINETLNTKENILLFADYSINLLDVSRNVSSNFTIGGDDFKVSGVDEDRGSITLGTAYRYIVKYVTYEVSYNYRFSSISSTNNFTAKVKKSF